VLVQLNARQLQQQQHIQRQLQRLGIAARPGYGDDGGRGDGNGSSTSSSSTSSSGAPPAQAHCTAACHPIPPGVAGGVVAFLPRNTDLQQLSALATECFARGGRGGSGGGSSSSGGGGESCGGAAARTYAAADAAGAGAGAAVGPGAAADCQVDSQQRQQQQQQQVWHVERNILNDHLKGVTLICSWAGLLEQQGGLLARRATPAGAAAAGGVPPQARSSVDGAV
jgi:hypothetical protein